MLPMLISPSVIAEENNVTHTKSPTGSMNYFSILTWVVFMKILLFWMVHS